MRSFLFYHNISQIQIQKTQKNFRINACLLNIGKHIKITIFLWKIRTQNDVPDVIRNCIKIIYPLFKGHNNHSFTPIINQL
nr:MAG TPA: hypothetical protein [Caudoviricetes sp.]DAU46205.1 MAG TPA: hypothetical protein [Caudoviricetes sp.]